MAKDKPGTVEIETFASTGELEEKVRHYLRNEAEREGIHLHFARWQINTDRYGEARKNLASVTNELWAASKKTLVKKLDGRVEAAKGINAAPAVPK